MSTGAGPIYCYTVTPLAWNCLSRPVTPLMLPRGDQASDRTSGEAAVRDFQPFVNAGMTSFDTAGGRLHCPPLLLIGMKLLYSACTLHRVPYKGMYPQHTAIKCNNIQQDFPALQTSMAPPRPSSGAIWQVRPTLAQSRCSPSSAASAATWTLPTAASLSPGCAMLLLLRPQLKTETLLPTYHP